MSWDRGWCQTDEKISREATVEQPKAAGFSKSAGNRRQMAEKKEEKNERE
ncbi:MAG: hypothetical protein IKQ97_09185 [Eubacterium sp.]|nr:hypothetical protein [Eubacterium sp.]